MQQLELIPDPEERSAPAVRLMTIAEAARRVRCCERPIRRAIDSGALRAGKVGGARGSRGGYRILSEDLDAWLYRDAS